MTGVASSIEAALSSSWLPVVLLVMVAADGPCPFLPSEPLLFAAVSRALGVGDAVGLGTLVTAALLGSLLGDAVLYATGRGTRRLVATTDHAGGWRGWAGRHLRARPIVVLAALRVVPGGRLVSVTAAGRSGVPTRRFVPATILSSLLWTSYMTGVGLLLAKLTGGDATWSLLAGLASGASIATVAALVGRLRRGPRQAAHRPGDGALGATHDDGSRTRRAASSRLCSDGRAAWSAAARCDPDPPRPGRASPASR